MVVMKMPIRLPGEPRDSALYLKGYHDAKLDYEVKHGRWVDRKFEDGEWYHTCSVCRMVLREYAFDNFCGNCGAKMDKVGE